MITTPFEVRVYPGERPLSLDGRSTLASTVQLSLRMNDQNLQRHQQAAHALLMALMGIHQ